jgi:hypothetical protein
LLEQLIIRFLLGGTVVSLFAVLPDVLKPRSFAALFGAAPSVALATLALAIRADGTNYARTEARSMIAGGAAFFLYTWAVSQVLRRWRVRVLPVTALLLTAWIAVAFAIWSIALRP